MRIRAQFAAVILEPMNVADPQPGSCRACRISRTGTARCWSSTRPSPASAYANGGAQELFGVTPDLATFGKGLANGYPLSAVAGRREIMKLMEEIFFSFTFGGEALSLAAAKATLAKLKREPVIEKLAALGGRILDRLPPLIAEHGLDHVFAVKGHPSWTFLTIADADGAGGYRVKTLLMQELHERGFLSVGTHNLNYAHEESDIDALLGAYAEIFPMIAEGLRRDSLDGMIRGKTLIPLFKVR